MSTIQNIVGSTFTSYRRGRSLRATLAGAVTVLAILSGCSGVTQGTGVEATPDGTPEGPSSPSGAPRDGSPTIEGSDGTADAGTDGSSASHDSLDSGTGLPVTCFSPTLIDATKYAYAPALVSVGACTTNELAALVSFEDNEPPKATLADLEAQVGSTCRACAFTERTAALWGPFLTNGANGSGNDYGGCMQVKSGKEACGRTYHQAAMCRDEACASGCTTAQQSRDCRASSAVFGGPCKGAYDALTTACGASLGPSQSACSLGKYAFQGAVAAQCITGS